MFSYDNLMTTKPKPSHPCIFPQCSVTASEPLYPSSYASLCAFIRLVAPASSRAVALTTSRSANPLMNDRNIRKLEGPWLCAWTLTFPTPLPLIGVFAGFFLPRQLTLRALSSTLPHPILDTSSM
ncbi:hypothetical protein B0H34DRAFT_812195 [Crassisporium funariophilum]|nr:hypothetical protein B0H34DRAFT_812195 [Crassisporium funariophilum]